MTRYIVQSNEIRGGGQWLDCVREDLYDGDNEEVFERAAIFPTRAQATAFIADICSLMHCGGDPDWFRIIEKDEYGREAQRRS